MPVRQQLLADLRDLIRTHKLTFDLPRMRLRSLDVIPLSLSLPRHTPITKVTAALNPLASVSSWASLSSITSVASPLTTPLISSLRSFYSATPPSSLSKLPPLLTWNPSSLKTIHQLPSRKMNHILKLSHKHICFLQETQWSSVQYNHLLLQSPFCTITHAPAINTSSSGVAILLPKTLTPSTSSIIAPGYILSVSISIGGITVELINVYLHPEHVGALSKTLLKHLRTDFSRSHPFRIIGGDFNQLHTKPIFQDILMELDSPPPPLMPTFRKANGYNSPLDFFLFQLPPSTYSMTTPKFTTFWPEYQPLSCMTDSTLFLSISSPNYVANIRFFTPKLTVHPASPNSPPLLPLLGTNVALLPLRSLNIQELYVPLLAIFALQLPNLIVLLGLPALSGLTSPPLFHPTGRLFYISMLMLQPLFLLVPTLPAVHYHK